MRKVAFVKSVMVCMIWLVVFALPVFAQEFPAQQNVPLDKEWKVTFNQPVNEATLQNNIVLWRIDPITQTRVKVDITPIVDLNSSKVVLIKHSAPFVAATGYELSISVGVKDVMGNPLSNSVGLSFMTQGQPAYALEGFAFLDGNVSRAQDKGESGIGNIKLSIRDSSNNTISQTTTDQGGYYKFQQIPEGDYNLLIDPANASLKSLNYYSKEPTASDLNDCSSVSETIALKITQNTTKHVGLMQGWMTNPFTKESYAVLTNPVDLDYRLGFYRDYSNLFVEGEEKISQGDNKPWGLDNHQGIDWFAKEGTPILSMGPGVVIFDKPTNGGANSVRVLYQIGKRAFICDYGHNSKNNVKYGDKVSRGQIIGFVGHTGTRDDHVHSNLWEIPVELVNEDFVTIRESYILKHYPMVNYSGGNQVPSVLDLFRDISDPKSENLWTIDNKPQYLDPEDNADYKYFYDGCEVKDSDLATSIGKQYPDMIRK